MSFQDAYELVWDRGKSVDPEPTTCVVSFTDCRDRDLELADAFARHLDQLGGFEIPAADGRTFVVQLTQARSRVR